jgi:hypothetical protein
MSAVQDLQVRCLCCSWIGTLRHRNEHLAECPALLQREVEELRARLQETETLRESEERVVTARVMQKLDGVLNSGRAGGHELADMMAEYGSAELPLISLSLRAAASLLWKRASSSCAPLEAPPPPPVRLSGIDLSADIAGLLLDHICALPTRSKVALASTCRLWHRMLSHPARWQTVELPRKLGPSQVITSEYVSVDSECDTRAHDCH